MEQRNFDLPTARREKPYFTALPIKQERIALRAYTAVFISSQTEDNLRPDACRKDTTRWEPSP